MPAAFEFELATETVDGCLAAGAGGADRVELCRQLQVGGLTPAEDLVARAVAVAGLPVHVLVRPHAQGFVYSRLELAAMQAEIRTFRKLGVAGVVVGVLDDSGRVAVERTRALVDAAEGLEVTFHRAFDETSGELLEAFEAVASTGCRRLLTSGREADVLTGTPALAELVGAADGRLRVAAGGGLRLDNARELAQRVAGLDFHGSLGYLGGTVKRETVQGMVAELQAGKQTL